MALAACNNGNPQDQKAIEPESTAIQATNDNLPKKDIITDEGLGEFKIGDAIPDSHPDYDIKAVVSVDEEEMEEVSVEFSKDGVVQFIIFPAYIDETDAQSNEIGGIMVVSDQFTHNGIGVGSNVNDILKANPDLEVTFYDDQISASTTAALLISSVARPTTAFCRKCLSTSLRPSRIPLSNLTPRCRPSGFTRRFESKQKKPRITAGLFLLHRSNQ